MSTISPSSSEAEIQHHYWMSQAIQLAQRGLYTTDPNPRVGCVLVKGNRLVGQGWHQYAGQGHAEVNALAQAQQQANGATAYVTLEPCSHTGKTPPCTEALIKAGIAQVIVAMQDPNPLVAGKGLKTLENHGMEVQCGLLAAQAAALNPGFISRMQRARPWVRCKMAISLDGRTAMKNGASKWITGAAARSDVQRWRARSSAILTGINTVLEDDPSMTVRPGDWQGEFPEAWLGPEGMDEAKVRQPIRIILDSDLRIASTAKILSAAAQSWLFHRPNANLEQKKKKLINQGAKVVALKSKTESVDIAQLLQYLAEQEINEVWLESGATLAGKFVQLGLVDEFIIYMAPKLMGHNARGLFNLPGIDAMADSLDLEWQDIRQVGNDLRIIARPALEKR